MIKLNQLKSNLTESLDLISDVTLELVNNTLIKCSINNFELSFYDKVIYIITHISSININRINQLDKLLNKMNIKVQNINALDNKLIITLTDK